MGPGYRQVGLVGLLNCVQGRRHQAPSLMNEYRQLHT